MIVKIKLPPESQEVLDKKEWFPIIDGGSDFIIGDGAYARVLDESEYILTEKTTADEFNKDYIVAQDPGDENTNRRKKGRRNSSRRRTTRRKSIGERRKS